MAQKQWILEEITKYVPGPYITTDKHIDCQPCNNCGRLMIGVKFVLRRDMLRYGKHARLPKCEICKKPCCPDCFRANPHIVYYCKDKCMELASEAFVHSHLDHKAWLKRYETNPTYFRDTMSKRHTITIEFKER